MSDALAATEMVLAREQQLHALDGLAAAAAHELGTPLSTIAVVAKELAARAPPDGSQFAEDLALLQSQAERCREILRKLTRGPDRARSAARAHERHAADRGGGRALSRLRRRARRRRVARAGSEGAAAPSRSASAGPASSTASATWSRTPSISPASASRSRPTGRRARSRSTIADDGPGFPPDVMDALGEPYITTRPARPRGQTSRTANHRAWASASSSPRPCWSAPAPRVTLENRQRPQRGAIVRIELAARGFRAQAGAAPALTHGACRARQRTDATAACVNSAR